MKNKSWLTKDIFGYGLTSFFNDFSHEITTSLLPIFISQMFGITNAAFILGLVTGISNAFDSVAKLFSGIISDKIKNKKILLFIGYFITPFFCSLIGAARYVWQIVFFRSAGWMGRGMREPVRDAILVDMTERVNLGRVFGFVRFSDTLGAICGPLLVFLFYNHLQLKIFFYLSIIPGFFSIMSLWALTSDITKSIKIKSAKSEHLYSLGFKFYKFVIIMFIFGLSNFNKTFFILKSAQNNVQLSILLYVIWNIIRAPFEYIFGALSDKFEKPRQLLAIFGFGTFSLSCILLLLSNNFLAWLIIFILSAMSTASVTTLEKTYAGLLISNQDQRGTGFGILQAMDGFADLSSNIIFGFLWSYISSTAAFMYSIILSLVAMLLLLF